jgi:cytochrome c556
LDDKRKDFEIGGENIRQDKVWTNQSGFCEKKKQFLKRQDKVEAWSHDQR